MSTPFLRRLFAAGFNRVIPADDTGAKDDVVIEAACFARVIPADDAGAKDDVVIDAAGVEGEEGVEATGVTGVEGVVGDDGVTGAEGVAGDDGVTGFLLPSDATAPDDGIKQEIFALDAEKFLGEF